MRNHAAELSDETYIYMCPLQENWDSPMPHVDHCGDKEFRHIVSDFETQTDESGFVKFHHSLAVYQLLCEDCHHKKSKRW